MRRADDPTHTSLQHSRRPPGAIDTVEFRGSPSATRRHAARTASVPPPVWAALAPPCATLDTVVVVPVRSEAARLAATLAALAAQIGSDGRPFAPGSFEVIVLANNCTDTSARVVRLFAARHPDLNLHVAEVTFPPSKAHVGQARACLMDEACRRLLSVGRTGGIIASTDGDTRVAPDWLASIGQEIRDGADAVGGRIEMSDERPLPSGLARLARRDATYQHLRNRLEHVLDPNPADPWPRHHQHFGASLAITVDAYLRVGGLPAKPFLEDEALCRALRAHDMKLRHSDKVKVVTSNRRRGRVAVGLSWQLREWSVLASDDADAEVDDPTALAQDLMLRRRLRDCWAACRGAANAPVSAGDAPEFLLAVLAAALRVPAGWLQARVRTSETFGALWLAVSARRRPNAGTRMPMRQAIALLRAMLASDVIPSVDDDENEDIDPARDDGIGAPAVAVRHAPVGVAGKAATTALAAADTAAVGSSAQRGRAGNAVGASRSHA